MRLIALSVFLLTRATTVAFAAIPEFSLSLPDAESRALTYSHRVKSAAADAEAASSQSGAQLQALLPRLSLQANYQYFAQIPQVAIGPFPAIGFGANQTWSVGPALSFTLFDGFSALHAYQSAGYLETARQEDRRGAELQLLASIRAAYVQVQLGLEELRAIHDSWRLASAQRHDVGAKFRAGAASRLELVTAERSELGNQIQFEQRQLQLAGSLRDLLELLGDERPLRGGIDHPGPPGFPETRLALRLDPLEQTLSEQLDLRLPEPADVNDPQARSLAAQAESIRRSATSQSGRAWPLITLNAAVNYNQPNVPNPPNYWQETAGANLSLPLFLGDPSHAQAAQLRAQALAAEERAQQRQDDVQRDYLKGLEALGSLKVQRRLAAQDVTQSEQQARLYYTSYKAGKINFIDVQNANVQALQAKVNAARIDAQIINQIVQLRSLGQKPVSGLRPDAALKEGSS